MTVTRAQVGRIAVMTALWAFALTCMAIGSFTFNGDRDPAQRAWFSWGIFLALVAQVPTGWCLLAWYARRERVRIEHLAQIMAHEAGRHHDDDDHDGGSVVTLR